MARSRDLALQSRPSRIGQNQTEYGGIRNAPKSGVSFGMMTARQQMLALGLNGRPTQVSDNALVPEGHRMLSKVFS